MDTISTSGFSFAISLLSIARFLKPNIKKVHHHYNTLTYKSYQFMGTRSSNVLHVETQVKALPTF